MNRPNFSNPFAALITIAALLGISGCPLSASSDPSAPPVTAQAQEETGSTVNPQKVLSEGDGYQAIAVVENLDRPWGVAWLPNGDILITERAGRLRIVRDGQLDPEAIAGVPDVLAQGQGGLLDIALHPDFGFNGWVYFTYSDGTIRENQTQIARAKFDGDRLTDWEVIFKVSQSKNRAQHFGARLLWLPDGTLLAAIGDGGNPPIRLDGELIRQQAQNLNSHLGKVIRINDDGSIPEDNPFVDDPSATPEVWSYGHRNIQGLALNALDGAVWATEHGARGGDEVNRVEPGENYGWPVATHSREYSGGLISPETSLPGMVDPVVIWTPSIAPSGLAVYSGDRFPDWRGFLFAGALVDQEVRRIELDGSGNVIREVPMPMGQRVRDVRQGPDGFLYVLTDASDGRLIRLVPMGTSQ